MDRHTAHTSTHMYARMYPHADTHLYHTHTRDVRMRMYTYSADPDQTPYIVAPDQGLYCLL